MAYAHCDMSSKNIQKRTIIHAKAKKAIIVSVAKACNYHARAIKHVRHLLPESVAQTLACSLINSRLDYCNSLLYGPPASTINKLQRTQNDAARVVLAAKRHSDAKPLLRQLHWLQYGSAFNTRWRFWRAKFVWQVLL